jgi:predicted nucleotidyltransferase
VIELPIENFLDINGWEIRKALALLNKSNPVLFEWLSSPVFYLCNQVVVDDMRSLSGWDYHRGAASHHYQHLAERSTPPGSRNIFTR